MVAINFKKKFSGKVESCEKQNTIRKKARCKPGDKLQLYTGMRTKNCRKLIDATCLNVLPVIIVSAGRIRLGDNWLGEKALQDFAKKDGFNNSADMADFFEKEYEEGLPFHGVFISWIPTIKK